MSAAVGRGMTTLRSGSSMTALIATAGLLLAGAARAQPGETTSPPRLVEFAEATYPPAALAAGRSARVELVITIGPDGAVTDVQVAGPVGDGFDEAAVDAARRFRFEAARLDGKPVAARVRYEYVFTPPPPGGPAPEPRGRLEGHVLDRARSEPIAGADVRVEGRDGVVTRGQTDGEGAFGFDA